MANRLLTEKVLRDHKKHGEQVLEQLEVAMETKDSGFRHVLSVCNCAIDPGYPSGLFVQEPSELVQGLIHLPAMNYWFRGLLHQIEGDL